MDIQESVKLIDSYLDLNRKVVGVKFFHSFFTMKKVMKILKYLKEKVKLHIVMLLI